MVSNGWFDERCSRIVAQQHATLLLERIELLLEQQDLCLDLGLCGLCPEPLLFTRVPLLDCLLPLLPLRVLPDPVS